MTQTATMVASDPDMTPSHLGSADAVVAVSYVLITITCLFTVLRISIALLRRSRFRGDDALLISAVMLGLVSAICMAHAVTNGLGRSIIAVHAGQLGRYFKLSYSSNIFAILAMAASKFSVVALVQRLTPDDSPSRRYIRLLYPVVASWTIFSVFGLAFQCSVPAPWIYSPSRCTGHGAIWYPIAVVSVATDIVLAFGFLPAIKGVQISLEKKSKIIGLFLVRLIVPIFSITHIAVLTPALRSIDQTLVMTIPSILAQITMNLSILTAAIPALSRTVTSLESTSPAAVVSEITAVSLDASHSRTTSDENKRLRDWALAQLRNTSTPSSMNKDMAVDITESPRKPESAHIGLERRDAAPSIPSRSDRRAASPQLTLSFTQTSSHLDVKEAWFVDSKRTSSMTEDTIDEIKRQSH